MRIALLEHPREPSPAHFNDIANTPLWSCLMSGYAGAALSQAGFEVKIIDAGRWTFPDTLLHLLEDAPDVLMVHAVYFWEKTARLFQLLTEFRQQRPDTRICLFGFFPTLAWQDILAYCPAVDYIAVGEPEDTLVELAHDLKTGMSKPILGLARQGEGKTAFAGWRPPITPLDRLPWPLRPNLATEETVSILASRGCYNCCSFCLIPTLQNSRPAWRSRSVADIVAEIASLKAQGKSDFYFVDPNFIGPGQAGQRQNLQLAQRLAELDITFGMECRSNDLNPELMRALVAAGLTSLLLGIESGGSQALQRLGKRTDVSQNETAINIVRAAGLEPEIGFIMFDAFSSLDDIFANLRFLQQNSLLDRLGRTANLLYHDYIAFKGTKGYQLALAQGRLVPQGLFGFEGKLLYDDFRVGWLASMMKPLCQAVLREMDASASPIHWRSDSPRRTSHRLINDWLVAVFHELLSQAAVLKKPPATAWSQLLLQGILEDFQQQLTNLQPQAQNSNSTKPLHHPTKPLNSIAQVPALPPLKQCFPFRLGTTSYIVPTTIRSNICFLGPLLDEVELVLYECDDCHNLPSITEIKTLAAMATDFDLTYNVHLPGELFFADSDPERRRQFCDTALRFYERTLDLQPTAYILHLDSRQANGEVEEDQQAWTQRIVSSLAYLRSHGMDLRHVLVENLEYPLGRLLPFVQAFDVGLCLDIGHLIRYGHNLETHLQDFLDRCPVIHLHGVHQGEDHLGLHHLASSDWELICRHLATYNGVVSLEIFSLADLESSLQKMAELRTRKVQP